MFLLGLWGAGALAGSVPPEGAELGLWLGGVYNNHVELGLSLDPNSIAVEREDPQLPGWVGTVRMQAAFTPFAGRWGDLQVATRPGWERYRGEDPLLRTFDGYSIPLELRWAAPRRWGYPLTIAVSGVRRSRRSALYDSWETLLEVALGQAIGYRVRRRRFDDAELSRRDYLLIGSLRQELWLDTEVRLSKSTALRGTLRSQLERYDPARDPLLALAVGERPGFRRLDWRQNGEAIFYVAFRPTLLLTLGAQGLWNRSSTAFYTFQLAELRFGLFWTPSERISLLGEVARGGVWFPDRRLIGRDARRQDRSWRLELGGVVSWSSRLRLRPRLLWIRNRTNETRPELQLLNFDQWIVELRTEWQPLGRP